MKKIPSTTIPAGIAAILASSAWMLASSASAIEAPADNAPPPAIAEALPAKPDAEPAANAKAEIAYLGVVSSAIPEMLAAHIGIKAGEGIVVSAVMPDGPAAKAGIAVHDVITRVGEKAIASAEDLTRQIGARKPGEAVHLELIQQGKPASADVTLGVRPATFAAGIEPRPLDQLNLDGVPEELADRLRGMIQGNLGGIELRLGEGGGPDMAPQLNEAMREMRLRMEKAMQGLDAQGMPQEKRLGIQQGTSIKLLDDQGSIELNSNEGGKEVTIRDKDHSITWNGPWDTEQDKAAAPDDIRKRVSRLNLDHKFQGNGLRLQLRQAPAPGKGDGNE